MIYNTNSLEFDERKFLNSSENYKIYSVSTFDKMYSKLHEHDFIEIFCLVSGSVNYVVEQGSFELKDYDIVLVPPHSLHKLTIKSRDVEYKRLVLWISKQYLDKLSSENSILFESISKFTNNGIYLIRKPEFFFEMKPYLEKIMSIEFTNVFGKDLLIDNTFREMFIKLYNFDINQNKIVEFTGNPIVLKILDYIANNLKNELSLEEIANELDLDEFYISHLFVKKVGTTIHKYIIKKRLSQGKKLLEQGSSIKDCIQEIGFKDESYFIQSFKKEFGYTPKQYKNKIKN